MVKKGIPPFYEPQLEELLKKVVETKNLKAETERNQAVVETDISFITVGTPPKLDGSVDLRFVEDASEEVGEALEKKKPATS